MDKKITKKTFKTNTLTQIAKDLVELARRSSKSNTPTPRVDTTSISSGFSQIEAAILSAHNPFDIDETEVININGQQGLWANKSEIQSWNGPIPLSEYQINDDPNPEIIKKIPEVELKYEQEISVRYLRPPTPSPPGDIIINLEKNTSTPPAPPLIIRQQPPRLKTPPPLIIREAPPKAPSPVEPKVITIAGRRLPPPPRRVIIERLAQLPSRPQSIIVERWLPYKDQKRRVIYQKAMEHDPPIEKPKNVIIQWEIPRVTVKQDFKDLGVIRADPNEYIEKYSAEVKFHKDLPEFVREIKPPKGVNLAAEYKTASVFELIGDVDALKLVDLDKEGLSEYKHLIEQNKSNNTKKSERVERVVVEQEKNERLKHISNIDQLIAEVFNRLDRNSDGRISRCEAEQLLMILNAQLGRKHGNKETKEFFSKLRDDKQKQYKDGSIDFEEFKKAMFDLF